MSSLVTSGLELCLPSLSMGACSEQGVRSACLGKVGTDVGGCPCETVQQCFPVCAGMFGLRLSGLNWNVQPEVMAVRSDLECLV